MAKENLAMIGFRLDSESRETLESLALERGETASELVRQIVVERLDASGQVVGEERLDAVEKAFSKLNREMCELRKDLSVSVQAILVASRQVTAEQAELWVKQNLYCEAD